MRYKTVQKGWWVFRWHKLVEIETVFVQPTLIELDPNKKYALTMPAYTSQEDFKEVCKYVKKFSNLIMVKTDEEMTFKEVE